MIVQKESAPEIRSAFLFVLRVCDWKTYASSRSAFFQFIRSPRVVVDPELELELEDGVEFETGCL